jgi:hypothetical protein
VKSGSPVEAVGSRAEPMFSPMLRPKPAECRVSMVLNNHFSTMREGSVIGQKKIFMFVFTGSEGYGRDEKCFIPAR